MTQKPKKQITNHKKKSEPMAWGEGGGYGLTPPPPHQAIASPHKAIGSEILLFCFFLRFFGNFAWFPFLFPKVFGTETFSPR